MHREMRRNKKVLYRLGILLSLVLLLWMGMAAPADAASDSRKSDFRMSGFCKPDFCVLDFRTSGFCKSDFRTSDFRKRPQSDSREQMNGYGKTNEETGYQVVVFDGAELMSSEQLESILTEMYPLTAYGNFMLCTGYFGDSDARSQQAAVSIFHEYFGQQANGGVFMIDMQNRFLYIETFNEVYQVITQSDANVITDNVYRYAMDGDYYQTSIIAFQQMYRLLEGAPIAQPMKLVTSALIALITAFMINFILVRFTSRSAVASRQEILSGLHTDFRAVNPSMRLTNTTRSYSPRSSSGGSRSGGGGGGGGGSHGGGGHHF